MGYVYVMEVEGSPLLKIGKTGNIPRVRLGQIQCWIPFKITLLRVYPCDAHWAIERLLHKKLAGYRKMGEWFAIDVETIDQAFNDVQREFEEERAR